MPMNSKGQAFSTFQLLIAAVIALMILVLLVNIISNIIIPGGQDPSSEAVQLLNSAINSPSELKVSKEVTFRPGASLNSKAIAEKTGSLTENQVCVSGGDVQEEVFSLSPNGKILTYNGSSASNFKLYVICDKPGAELQNDLAENQLEDSSDWFEGDVCSSILDSGNKSRGCLVAVTSS